MIYAGHALCVTHRILLIRLNRTQTHRGSLLTERCQGLAFVRDWFSVETHGSRH